MAKKVDLTAIITMHNEGVLAHKTIRSVFEAIEEVEASGYTYEIIIHIDNGDEATKKYVERYRQLNNFTVYENSFGDTGPSRNFAAERARGRYVSFLDGDDLVSSNWYIKALGILEESKEEVVVHPEAILTFGVDRPNVLTIQKDSFDKDKDTMILLGENRWGSVLMARKETLLNNPYRVLGGGYGHEDYVFNLDVIGKGILHKVAKGTVLFYRRSDSSRLSSSNDNNVTIPYVELFDFERVREIKEEVEISRRKSLKDKGYKAYKKIRENSVLNYFITPVAKGTLKVLEHTSLREKKKRIPDFVYDEWIKMNHIDSQLYPFKNTLGRMDFYSAEDQSAVGESYREIAKKVRCMPDYIFIVPWVVRGGADKVLFNYIKAMKEIRPDWNFTVISTLQAKQVWAKDLPDYVDYIDFGEYSVGLPPVLKERLLTRAIVQMQCKNIHIINSEYGYEWARCHKELLGREYNLSASLFAYEYIPGSNLKAVYSYDNPYLFEVYDVAKNVFTDNNAVIEYAMEQNGFNENKFKVHYQPVEYNEVEIKQNLYNEGELNILWAGRVVPVKMPEIVAEIGRKIGNNFKIHVYGEMSPEIDRKIFDNISSIEYHGVYDSFDSLPCEKMDIFLYTSLTDGMPNTILEATAAGLPIIASNDGGVGEFIQNKKTGILIEDKLDADAYVEAIEWAFENMPEMWKYTENAQKLLSERHSWEHFVEKVREDFNI